MSSLEVDSGTEGDTCSGPEITITTVFPMLTKGKSESFATMRLRHAMDAALWPSVLAELIECAEGLSMVPFGDLSPAFMNWSLSPVEGGLLEKLKIAPLKMRTRTVLRQNKIINWGDLSQRTQVEIGSFLNSGVTTIQDLTRAVIELGAAAGQTIPNPGSTTIESNSMSQVLSLMKTPFQSAVEQLARWALEETNSLTFGEAMDQVVSRRNAPNDIVELLEEIRSSSLAGHNPDSSRSRVVLSTILGQLSEQDARIVRCRSLSVHPPTLEELGKELGVTRERVRQIQVRADARFDEILNSPEFSPIRWRAHSLGLALGSFAPLTNGAVSEALENAVRGEEFERAAFRVLLLRLSGPYQVTGDFLMKLNPRELVQSLEELADEFGVMQGVDVTSILNEFDVLAKFHKDVITWLRRFRSWGNNLLMWPASGVEKAITVLALRGSPATIEEIIDAIGETYSDRSLQGRIAEDPRVARVSRHQFALKAWGLEEYSTIADAIASQIEKDGGESIVNEVVDKVSGSFGVRDSSVRLYIEAPMFFVANGVVRLRKPGEGIVVSQDISKCRGVYVLGADVIAFLVEVDGEVLRGSGRGIPQALAARLGVSPGMKLAFVSPFGDVIVSWPTTSATGPSLGSVRMCSMGAGCIDGQYMRLEFNTGLRTVAVVAVASWTATSDPSENAIKAITGIDASGSDDLMSAISDAIGVPKPGLRRALTERGDDFILRLLPVEVVRSDLGAALAELAKVLGEDV
jgi:hypothetical protein